MEEREQARSPGRPPAWAAPFEALKENLEGLEIIARALEQVVTALEQRVATIEAVSAVAASADPDNVVALLQAVKADRAAWQRLRLLARNIQGRPVGPLTEWLENETAG